MTGLQSFLFTFTEISVVGGFAFWFLTLIMGIFDLRRFLREINESGVDAADDGRVT